MQPETALPAVQHTMQVPWRDSQGVLVGLTRVPYSTSGGRAQVLSGALRLFSKGKFAPVCGSNTRLILKIASACAGEFEPHKGMLDGLA